MGPGRPPLWAAVLLVGTLLVAQPVAVRTGRERMRLRRAAAGTPLRGAAPPDYSGGGGAYPADAYYQQQQSDGGYSFIGPTPLPQQQQQQQQRPADPCAASPCRYGAPCVPVNGGSSYACRCGPGFSGPNCEVVDRCVVANPCLNGGACSPAGASYFCACRESFFGPNCERQDACRVPGVTHCRNGGVCVPTGGAGWQCACPLAFSGPQCDLVDACQLLGSSCLNGGECEPQGRSFFCRCRWGWQGERCERRAVP